MVLPKRFELLTSPLPRECSTTELRQLSPQDGIGNRDLHLAASDEARGKCHARNRFARAILSGGLRRMGGHDM